MRVKISRKPEYKGMSDARDFYDGEIGVVIGQGKDTTLVEFNDGCKIWFKTEEVTAVHE